MNPGERDFPFQFAVRTFSSVIAVGANHIPMSFGCQAISAPRRPTRASLPKLRCILLGQPPRASPCVWNYDGMRNPRQGIGTSSSRTPQQNHDEVRERRILDRGLESESGVYSVCRFAARNPFGAALFALRHLANDLIGTGREFPTDVSSDSGRVLGNGLARRPAPTAPSWEPRSSPFGRQQDRSSLRFLGPTPPGVVRGHRHPDQRARTHCSVAAGGGKPWFRHPSLVRNSWRSKTGTFRPVSI